jgi:hypothetical protein
MTERAERLRPHRPSPAAVVALIALFVAMGGTGYAALRVPRASVGTKQLKANAVTSPKVKDGTLLRTDVATRRLPKGQAGRQGLQGDQGPPGLNGLQGEQGALGDEGDPGNAGQPGPGTITLDGQFSRDGAFHEVTTVNGVSVYIRCDPEPDPGDKIFLFVGPVGADPGFYGWGTSSNGSALQRRVAVSGAITVEGVGVADLDVVAQASASNGKYTAVDLNGIAVTGCNYHALIVPPV